MAGSPSTRQDHVHQAVRDAPIGDIAHVALETAGLVARDEPGIVTRRMHRLAQQVVTTG